MWDQGRQNNTSKVMCLAVFASMYFIIALFCIVLVDFEIGKQTDNCGKKKQM